MSYASDGRFNVVSVGRTGMRIAVNGAIPGDVRIELGALDHVSTESRDFSRGLGESALDIVNLALAGVIGNAAWALIPHTAAFLGRVARRDQLDGALSVDQVGKVIFERGRGDPRSPCACGDNRGPA